MGIVATGEPLVSYWLAKFALKRKNASKCWRFLDMVRKRGFEPRWYCYRQPLKLVRLPVPPLPRGVVEDYDLTTPDNAKLCLRLRLSPESLFISIWRKLRGDNNRRRR